MPRNQNPVKHLHLMTREDRIADGDGHQLHWYYHVCREFGFGAWKSVLDVGASTGRGMMLLANAFDEVDGIDLLPLSDRVTDTPLEAFPDSSFDLVTAIDVIEHVEEDCEFLRHLRRVARCAVFLTTPNHNVSRCANEYHVREYTPTELKGLIGVSPEHESVWVSNAKLEIMPRPFISANEPWHNFGIMLHV